MPTKTRATARKDEEYSEIIADSKLPSTPISGGRSQQATPATLSMTATSHTTRKSRRTARPSAKLRESLGETDIDTSIAAQPRQNIPKTANLKLDFSKLNLQPGNSQSASTETSESTTSGTTTPTTESHVPVISIPVKYGAFSVLEAVHNESQIEARLAEHERLLGLKPQIPLVLSNEQALLLENREWNIYQRGSHRMGPKRVTKWPSAEVAGHTRFLWIEFAVPGMSQGFKGFLEYFMEWEAARSDALEIEKEEKAALANSLTTSNHDQASQSQLEADTSQEVNKTPHVRLTTNKAKTKRGGRVRKGRTVGFDGAMDSEDNTEASHEVFSSSGNSQPQDHARNSGRMSLKFRRPAQVTADTPPATPTLKLTLKKKPSSELHRSENPKRKAISPAASFSPHHQGHPVSASAWENIYPEFRAAIPHGLPTPQISQFDGNEISKTRSSIEHNQNRAIEGANVAGILNVNSLAPADEMQVDNGIDHSLPGRTQVDEIMHEAPSLDPLISASPPGQLSEPHSSPIATRSEVTNLMGLDHARSQALYELPYISYASNEDGTTCDHPPPEPILFTTFLHHLGELRDRGFNNLDCVVLELDYFPDKVDEGFHERLTRWLEWFRIGMAQRLLSIPARKVIIAGVPMKGSEQLENEKRADEQKTT